MGKTELSTTYLASLQLVTKEVQLAQLSAANKYHKGELHPFITEHLTYKFSLENGGKSV